MKETAIATPEQVSEFDDGHPQENTKVIELAHVSAHLSFEDQQDLRTYFRTNGTAACYGQSPTASVIARMRLFTKQKSSRECERCGGSEEFKRPGSGFEAGGSGLSPALAAILEKLAVENPDLPAAPDGSKVCRDCQGTGWVVDVASHARRTLEARTIDKRLAKDGRHYPAAPLVYRADEWRANPTGSSKPGGGGGGHALGESDVALLGRVSKRLEYVRQHEGNAPARASLERFLSEGSNGLLALWDLVPAGKILLRKRKGAIRPEQFFQNERVDQGKKGDPDRAALFDAADFQAKEALKVGYRLYNEAKAQ